MITSKCRSKNPSACPYHGKGQSLSAMEKEAAKQAAAGNYERYSFIRNAMDEIIRDTNFAKDVTTGDKSFDFINRSVPVVPTEAAPLQVREAELKAANVAERIKALENSKHQALFVAEITAYDRKFAQYDKAAAKALGLKVAKRGGIAFKFYDPISPAVRNPENYESITVPVRELRAGDIITTGTIHSVVRGAKTPSGKSEVIVREVDGNYRKSVWNSSTRIAGSREKVVSSV